MKWLRYYMLSLLLLTGGIACAQYQQIGHPTKWILNYPIESLDPETGEIGATLRKGLKLEVLLTLPDAWIVRPEQSHPGDPVLSIPSPTFQDTSVLALLPPPKSSRTSHCS